ncbi:MAG: polyprenol monophosphomannose synthase [Deltaproteobacteria bacterium]|jgi:dolichol-phosphate mannosyltransferase|nr:polyprenol monophosphomannose synthase [Deltaproteobacteria bacterium]
MRALVIIPTYNELENVRPLTAEIFKTVDAAIGSGELNGLQFEALIVDDNSPDRTDDAVRDIQKTSSFGSRLSLLSRPGKQGLGKAYLAGFAWGLERGFDVLVEMDADFSHRPVDLVKLLKAMLDGADFAVGSRYVEGGGTRNWGLGRKIISRGGSLYSRTILGHPLNDWTGGFNAWKASTLKGIGLERVKSEGYSFQIELKYRSLEAGFKGREVPIHFEDRRVGQSKMNARIVFEAFGRVWGMRFG